jgi:uncharacterized membrane protein
LEVVDLVTELRDTVKRIDSKRHTPKSLRRALANVSDIIADIQENLDQAKQEVKPA